MIAAERVSALEKEWVELLTGFGVAAAPASASFESLRTAYTQPSRHYHNLEHLTEMFEVATLLSAQIDDPAAVALAIWFHDVVYDPRAKDNEARSAELAADLLGPLGVPIATIERVGELVNATAHLASSQPSADSDAAVLIDADLAILGASAERYLRYSMDIRKEYAFVSDDDYRQGRAAVLQMFLSRPRIFRTRHVFEEREETARRNIAAELRDYST
ncbi:MAG TPA: hypothetical protein VLM40_17100 [Gemmata sp.]|nr:hypothetical protein [Gemmata sp.]